MDVPSTEAEVAEWAAEVTAVWGRRRTWEREQCTGASFAFHGAFLVMFFFMPPRPPSLTPELVAPDARHVRALLEDEIHVTSGFLMDGGTGTRHTDDQGAMGALSEEPTQRRFAMEGRADARETRLASASPRSTAYEDGVIGALVQMSGAFYVPRSPYAPDLALGADPMSALGALMGDQIGADLGVGGLGLRGTGRGGGGTGLGTIGLGTLGTVGHGAGLGHGSGYSSGAGGFRGRVSGVPLCRCCGGCEGDDRGGLSRESIRRVVRQHVNEVRFCYERGLLERPDLAGRVTVTFLVAPAGTVSTSSVASSTIEDQRVDQCVANAVLRWTFPSSEGPTAVTYPLVFESTP